MTKFIKMLRNISGLLVYYSAIVQILASTPPPNVCLQTSGACYRGSWLNSSLGNTYASFQGLKYAEAPIGQLRFKPPNAFIPGEAVFDVSKNFKVICPQFGMVDDIYTGQEDCLFLNVYVPENALSESDANYPVMVWIHGGGLQQGSGSFEEYGPQHFMDNEVIIVTMNYRLGPLGYLFLGKDDVVGNAGLQDQRLALQWVNDNIADFGGDPSLITIFGESAGSFSVSLHMLSPQSEGLFQRVIMQSGTVLGSSWGMITTKNALGHAKSLSIALGCNSEEDELNCLQEKAAEDIIVKSRFENVIPGRIIWMPAPDYGYSANPFIPGEPKDLMSSGNFNRDVEVIIGTNADEGILFFFEFLLNPSQWDILKDNFDILGPSALFNIAMASHITQEDVKKAHQIIDFYVGGSDNINQEHTQGMLDMMTDAGFLHGTHKSIKYLLAQKITLYHYILTYEGEYSFTQLFGVDPAGVCHADDLQYQWEPIFNLSSPMTGGLGPLRGSDLIVRNKIVSAWTNFAKIGDPTPPDSEYSWTPLAPGNENNFLNISGTTPEMDYSEYIKQRMDIWNVILG